MTAAAPAAPGPAGQAAAGPAGPGAGARRSPVVLASGPQTVTARQSDSDSGWPPPAGSVQVATGSVRVCSESGLLSPYRRASRSYPLEGAGLWRPRWPGPGPGPGTEYGHRLGVNVRAAAAAARRAIARPQCRWRVSASSLKPNMACRLRQLPSRPGPAGLRGRSQWFGCAAAVLWESADSDSELSATSSEAIGQSRVRATALFRVTCDRDARIGPAAAPLKDSDRGRRSGGTVTSHGVVANPGRARH